LDFPEQPLLLLHLELPLLSLDAFLHVLQLVLLLLDFKFKDFRSILLLLSEVVMVLLFLDKSLALCLEVLLLLGSFSFEFSKELLPLFSESVHLLMLALLLSEYILFHSLNLALFFLELLLLYSDIEI